MENFMRIDMHVHSKGVSLCSNASCQEIIDHKIEQGYDGAVLCNHCQSWYYPPKDHASFIERVIEEYKKGKAYADEKNFRFYLGLEVTIVDPHYADWLLYGVTEEFLRKTPCLYTLTQRQLFALCEENGIRLIQAHPFRAGQSPCHPQYMHGVEINCTRGDVEKADLVKSFAKKHDLIYTCGTDYHDRTRRYCGGTYIPTDCQTSVDIANFLRENGQPKIFMDGERP